MGYKSKKEFLQDTAKDLTTSVKFFHGRNIDFEAESFDEDFCLWLALFTKTPILNDSKVGFNDTTQFVIFCGKQTQMDDDSDVEYTAALDETGQILDEFVRLINWNWKTSSTDLKDASDRIQFISAEITEPKVNEFSNVLTGQVLVLTLNFPDDFDYCSSC